MREVSQGVSGYLIGRYVYLYFNGLNILGSVLCPFGNSSELPQQIRIVGQNSWVASFSGRGVWLQISLALSRFEHICQLAYRLGSCLGNFPLFCAVVGKRGRLLNLCRVASLGREVDLRASCFVPLAAK